MTDLKLVEDSVREALIAIQDRYREKYIAEAVREYESALRQEIAKTSMRLEVVIAREILADRVDVNIIIKASTR